MQKQFDPRLLPYDNAVEEFMEEMRKKNIHVVPPDSKWSDSHIAAHFPEQDAKQEAEFVANLNRLSKPKPWRLRAFIALTVFVFFWYELCHYLGMF